MALRENGGGRDLIASMAPSFIYSYAQAIATARIQKAVYLLEISKRFLRKI